VLGGFGGLIILHRLISGVGFRGFILGLVVAGFRGVVVIVRVLVVFVGGCWWCCVLC
jgi:hypothetical protein